MVDYTGNFSDWINQIFSTDAGQAGFMGSILGASLAALIITFLVVAIIITVAVYVYTSFAYRSIAKKVKYRTPNIAWIPIVGPALIKSKTAKMNWWPILLLIGVGIPFIGWACKLAFIVFSTIWLWKTFEKMRYPGWWALLCLIPIVNLVLLGIAAWSKK